MADGTSTQWEETANETPAFRICFHHGGIIHNVEDEGKRVSSGVLPKVNGRLPESRFQNKMIVEDRQTLGKLTLFYFYFGGGRTPKYSTFVVALILNLIPFFPLTSDF